MFENQGVVSTFCYVTSAFQIYFNLHVLPSVSKRCMRNARVLLKKYNLLIIDLYFRRITFAKDF